MRAMSSGRFDAQSTLVSLPSVFYSLSRPVTHREVESGHHILAIDFFEGDLLQLLLAELAGSQVRSGPQNFKKIRSRVKATCASVPRESQSAGMADSEMGSVIDFQRLAHSITTFRVSCLIKPRGCVTFDK